MKRIYIPTVSADDWRKHLAEPDKHWRSGYSAKTLAECWEQSNGFPVEFQRLFSSAGNQAFAELELLLAIPEYRVDLTVFGLPGFSGFVWCIGWDKRAGRVARD